VNQSLTKAAFAIVTQTWPGVVSVTLSRDCAACPGMSLLVATQPTLTPQWKFLQVECNGILADAQRVYAADAL